MKEENNSKGSILILILIVSILIALVLFAISRREKGDSQTWIETISDRELDSIEFGDLHNKKNRINKIAEFSFLSDLRDDLDRSDILTRKSREVSGESKSIYFNQSLTRISSEFRSEK
jgi:hypothetical protein